MYNNSPTPLILHTFGDQVQPKLVWSLRGLSSSGVELRLIPECVTDYGDSGFRVEGLGRSTYGLGAEGLGGEHLFGGFGWRWAASRASLTCFSPLTGITRLLGKMAREVQGSGLGIEELNCHPTVLMLLQSFRHT